MRSEGRDHRNVGGVPASRDQDAADPWLIVPRVEGEPTAAEKDFEPGVEIHRRRVNGNADVAQIAIAVARGNVETSAQRNGEMGEVATDADALRQGLVRRPCRPRLGITEPETLMNEIADRLHARPSAIDTAEGVPGEI